MMENGSQPPLNGLLSLNTNNHDEDEEMNGLDLTTKGASALLQQRASNGTPEKGDNLPPGQLSPSSLRRSTRASALKAQQKLKDGEVVPTETDKGSESEEDDDSAAGEDRKDEEGESASKKRKLINGTALDQFSPEFAIRQDKDGEVYMLSDGSEISSVKEADVEAIRKVYEKCMARELTEEQKAERMRMIKAAEADLRAEEAKLTMIKKMRVSQMQRNQAQDLRKLAASVSQNSAGNAYKPPVATPANKGLNNVTAATAALLSNAKNMAGLAAMRGNSMQQQAEMIRQLSTMGNMGGMNAATQALMTALARSGGGQQQAAALAALIQQVQKAQQQQQQHQQNASNAATAAAAASSLNGSASSSANHHHHSASSNSSSAAAAAAASAQPQNLSTTNATNSANTNNAQPAAQASAPQSTAAQLQSQTPSQRMATARLAFRKTADQQLMSLPPPKAPSSDLFFVPNGNQPDFCYLLGLDLVVQRVLKDKTVLKHVSERPYMCEECGTDYTPGWKAIGATEDDLHLYCEACVRAAQKKKIRNDRQNLLKKAYSKIQQQEKEFEKQIADGKLEAVIAQAAANAAANNSNAAAAAAAQIKVNSSPAVQNLSTKMSSSTAASPSVTAASTPKPASTVSTPSSSKPAASTPTSASSTHKRPATNSNTSSMQQLAAFTQLANNPMAMAAMMQLQAAGAAQVRNMQNMQNMQTQAAALSAMWGNPLMQLQMQQMLQQQQAQRMGAGSSSSGTSSSSSSASTQNAQATAMAMLTQLMQAQQRTNNANNQQNANSQALAQLAALNPTLMNSPQLMQQMQKQFAAHIKNLSAKK